MSENTIFVISMGWMIATMFLRIFDYHVAFLIGAFGVILFFSYLLFGHTITGNWPAAGVSALILVLWIYITGQYVMVKRPSRGTQSRGLPDTEQPTT